jgi:hypothetical protein
MKVSELKKQADKYFSKYVRLRDSVDGYGQCITCDRTYHWKQAQAGHFVSRSCNFLRYNDENVNLQCSGCNLFKAGDQYQYAKNLDLKYGTGTAEKLHSQRHTTHKFTAEELEKIIKEAKEYIKEMEQWQAL